MLRTGDVKGGITVWLVALNRRATVLLLTNVTLQRPPRLGHITQAVNGLEENGILEANLGNPQRTHDVTPFIVNCLLECAEQVWTRTKNI